MGCGGNKGVKGLFNRGSIPRQQRYVLDGEYDVQDGDDVSNICYVFGIAINRWQELVGANLHKPLGDDPPYGYKHRCFKSLEAGEKLNIPGGWGPGAVSGPRIFGQRRDEIRRLPKAFKRYRPAMHGYAWTDKLPNWEGTWLAYFSQRIWAVIEFNHGIDAKFHQAYEQGIGAVHTWLKRWPGANSFYEYMEHNIGCHGWDHSPPQLGATVPPVGDASYWYKDIWFAADKDPLACAMAASLFASVIPPCPGSGTVGGPLFSQAGSQLKPGQSSAPDSATISEIVRDQLKKFVEAMKHLGITNALDAVLQAFPLPAGADMYDAFAVVYSWWPYIKWPGAFEGWVPTLPTPAQPIPQGVTIDQLIKLAKNGMDFLRATGINDGFGTNVQNIPWDSVLWDDVPWNVIGAQAMQDLSQVMLGTPLPAYTTPPLTASQQQTPNFWDSEWSDEPWADILKDVDFSDSIADVLGDPDAVACIKKNPERMKKLAGCKNCYSDVEQFKTILCSSVPADPCDCDKPTEPKDPKDPKDPEDPEAAPPAEDNTALIVGASVIGVLGIAATAFALNRRK